MFTRMFAKCMKNIIVSGFGRISSPNEMGSNMISIHSFYLSDIAWIEKF